MPKRMSWQKAVLRTRPPRPVRARAPSRRGVLLAALWSLGILVIYGWMFGQSVWEEVAGRLGQAGSGWAR